ncbi:hypothetical protein, partial [Pontibacter rugosus]
FRIMKSQQAQCLLIDINIQFVFIAWKGTLHCGVFFYFNPAVVIKHKHKQPLVYCQSYSLGEE